MILSRVCLIHYHEIGLKGRNRSFFEKRLIGNIRSLLSSRPYSKIARISGRICLLFDDGVSYQDAITTAEFIAQIPGVARVSCGFKCNHDLESMYETAHQALIEAGDFETFKVQARRNHTDFPHDSMELNQLVGAYLCRSFPTKKVKMKQPDVEVRVEVIEGFSYIYAFSIRGIGGLPVGTAGKVVCMMSSGIDSPIAAWRLARRGAIPVAIHFSGRPETLDTSEYLVDDICHVLESTGCVARLYVAPIGDYQRGIAEMAPSSLRIILYRRFMYKIAEKIALIEDAKALVTGESLGQVASQTLENILCTNAAVTLPVFRPLIGSDKVEIINEAEKLGTYEISSQDAPDCCTLYMPRSPETHARLEKVLEAESLYPLDDWIEEVMENLEVHDYQCPSFKK